MFLVQHIGITAGMVIIVYLFMFLLGNVIGYVFEVLFRRFVSAGKWVNPGFMRGPWLPLYGFGLVLMLTMVMLIVGNLPSDMLFGPVHVEKGDGAGGGCAVHIEAAAQPADQKPFRLHTLRHGGHDPIADLEAPDKFTGGIEAFSRRETAQLRDELAVKFFSSGLQQHFPIFRCSLLL